MRIRRPFSWTIFYVAALAGCALFFFPAFVIRPFRYQAPRALTVAMALRHISPWGTIAALAVCLAMAFVLWESDNWLRKIVIAIVLVPVVFSTVMSRLNYFEWMFHPIKSAEFESEAASKLESGEMIMAVRFGSDARAYPIREMAYHHLLNDIVGGIPVTVTY